MNTVGEQPEGIVTLLVDLVAEGDGTSTFQVLNVWAPADHRVIFKSTFDDLDEVNRLARKVGDVVAQFYLDQAWRADPDNAELAAQTPWCAGPPPMEFKKSGQ
ncbi:hypothetical protein [Demequina zhanjiangensis]|uniref:Antibiotic biosynthesis monooxygenase n=1 Tax=Demequina zhanjiangensis TaxID=3051659 RepID=A0ABT8G361_9MICO|nr:hypothetical protein [Demequina sp. SYSU T00b26]MDN4473579.1 hypothetical protein [Demequina sp. SYSU T00b26]